MGTPEKQLSFQPKKGKNYTLFDIVEILWLQNPENIISASAGDTEDEETSFMIREDHTWMNEMIDSFIKYGNIGDFCIFSHENKVVKFYINYKNAGNEWFYFFGINDEIYQKLKDYNSE